MKIKDIVKLMDEWAPFETALDFDNVGLLIGDACEDVRGILIALDITLDVIDEAKELGANLIVTHHPVIFHSMKEVTYNAVQGKHCVELIKNGISVISAHTNLDMADGGISDKMAQLMKLENVIKPEINNLFRVGELSSAMDAQEFKAYVGKIFASNRVFSAGSAPQMIKRVCVIGGAAGDGISEVCELGVDAYLLGSIKHDQAIAAQTLGVYTITAGHYETEVIILPEIKAYLQKAIDDVQLSDGINITINGKNPFDI